MGEAAEAIKRLVNEGLGRDEELARLRNRVRNLEQKLQAQAGQQNYSDFDNLREIRVQGAAWASTGISGVVHIRRDSGGRID